MSRRPLAGALVALAVLAAAPAFASSHREAPGITEMPKVDGTDFYMFNSYESGRAGYVTLIANYLPLQDAYGGPNYFTMDTDASYRIHIDNSGDGVEDITFDFQVDQQLKDIQLPVGGQNVSIPLSNAGPLTGDRPGVRAGTLNVRESYTVWVVRGAVDSPTSSQRAQNGSGGVRFPKPFDNIGQKSIPDYANYANQFISDISIPGCNAGEGRVFVGQRKESFAVNLGEIFDLVNIANPLGPRNAEPNDLEDKNITTFAIEVPTACLITAGQPVIGAWTTAALPRNRVLVGTPTFNQPTQETGPYVQVSRLGMPLVNEVVIGLKDKNKFNVSIPKNDLTNFALYVTNPTLPEVLEILFGAAGVRAPNNFPRTDLVATFVTGVEGVNKFGIGEMQRLNTSIAATPAGAQNNLGVLGGDNAGFPNGRRPGDDVVDAELRVAMGVLCHAFPGVFCDPADAPSGLLPFTDGTLQDASQFDSTFPYLKTPLPGSPNEAN